MGGSKGRENKKQFRDAKLKCGLNIYLKGRGIRIIEFFSDKVIL